MLLSKIIQQLPSAALRGNKNVNITALCSNSQAVRPGNLFIAKKGATHDGAKYIPDAIAGGAAAILTDLYDPTYSHVAQLIVDDVAAIEPRLAAFFYGHPSRELFTVAITGTNGKTTTAYLTRHLLEKVVGPAGLIGTIEYFTGKRHLPAAHTTPDVTKNHELLREMVDSGCRAAVMEVTSHALAQGRSREIDFDVAIFTNLSQDHLDYHGAMESYALAKRELFLQLNRSRGEKKGKKWAVLNGDDPYSPFMTRGCASIETLTYGIEKECDLSASEICCGRGKSSLTLNFRGKKLSAMLPLVGRYNIYNGLAAIAALLTQGIHLEELIALTESFPNVPGRMEAVSNPLNLNIVVDFAHTEEALKNALITLREMNPCRIITLFGCGGGRDRGKRPKMGRVSGELSDITIVTSDNPRGEDPQAIVDEITKGFLGSACYYVEVDRREAIRRAIGLATEEDIILIAGRGHETSQIISHKRVDFDDRLVARQLSEERAKELLEACKQ